MVGVPLLGYLVWYRWVLACTVLLKLGDVSLYVKLYCVDERGLTLDSVGQLN